MKNLYDSALATLTAHADAKKKYQSEYTKWTNDRVYSENERKTRLAKLDADFEKTSDAARTSVAGSITQLANEHAQREKQIKLDDPQFKNALDLIAALGSRLDNAAASKLIEDFRGRPQYIKLISAAMANVGHERSTEESIRGGVRKPLDIIDNATIPPTHFENLREIAYRAFFPGKAGGHGSGDLSVLQNELAKSAALNGAAVDSSALSDNGGNTLFTKHGIM